MKNIAPVGFHERIYDKFLQSNLSIAQLSELSNVAITSVYGCLYYHAVPTLSVTAKLAKALNTSIDYLVYG